MAGSSRCVSALVVMLVALALVQRASSHGAMIQPMSRQMVIYQFNQSNNPHDMGRGGGSVVVSKNNTLIWPDGVHPVCGDSPNDTRLAIVGKVVQTYTKGSVISMSYFISTNHLGRFSVQLCNADAKSEQECSAPLMRADGKGTGWWLPNRGTFKFAGSGDAFDYEDGSYNMTTFGNWSNWCQSSFSCACYAPDHCTMFRESSVFTTKWRLPSSGPWATCRHCVLRSYWLTGHTCTPPCTRDHPFFPDCGTGVTQDSCSLRRLDAYPEMYWSCSDISITDEPSTSNSTNTAPSNTTSTNTTSSSSPSPERSSG